jgi:hypothetical protein
MPVVPQIAYSDFGNLGAKSISSRSTHYSNIIKYEYFDSNDVPVEYPNTLEYR